MTAVAPLPRRVRHDHTPDQVCGKACVECAHVFASAAERMPAAPIPGIDDPQRCVSILPCAKRRSERLNPSGPVARTSRGTGPE
jgi:hypothetical protein